MADLEQRFFFALLTANRAEQNSFHAKQIPRGVFVLREKEAAWVFQFRERHGQYPSVKMYNLTFKDAALRRHPDPLNAALQPILDMAMFSQMRQLTNRAKDALDRSNNVSEALGIFKAGVNSLTNYSVDYVDVAYATTMQPYREYKERLKQLAEGTLVLIDTPWPRINRLVKYYSAGDTVVLAARLSLGKTWVIIEWAHYLVRKGIPVLFITKEMSTSRISERFEAKRFRLNYDAMREGVLKPAAMRRWMKERHAAAKKPGEHYPLVISGDETIAGVGLSHVIAKIEQYRPMVVMIDGAYLLTPEGMSARASERERFAELSKKLKAIAKATSTVIVEVLQMNRNAEKKDTTKGTVGDIYGADNWAQDADGVFELGGQRASNTRNLNILKGRDSAVGEVTLNFSLDPYPNLTENSSMAGSQKNNMVTFRGV